jgi:accessory gene regulator protein AgrB
MAVSLCFILIVGWICGAFNETLLITFAALFMKHFIGGPHLSGFIRCTGFSAFMLVGTSWLLRTFGIPPYEWLIVLSILGIIVVLYYGPLFASDFNFNKNQVKIRKFLGALVLILLVCLNIRYRNIGVTSLLFGALLTVMLRAPIGVFIVQGIEKLTKGTEV